MPNPWSNQIVSLVIITAPSGAFAGIFLYAPTPGPGNLIASLAANAGTDPFGNNYPQGFLVQGSSPVIRNASGNFTANLSAGELDFIFILSTLLKLSASGVFLYVSPGGTGNLIAALASAAGTDSSGNTFPQGLMSQQLTLVNQVSPPPSFTGGSVYYSSTAGRPRYLSSAGADNVVQRSDVNTSQFTQGNSTTPATISSTLTYQANEGSLSSEYELEVDGVIITGSVTAQTLTIAVAVDGTVLGGSITIGAVPLPINTTYAYTIRGRITITSVGAGGTVVVTTDGGISRQGVNAGSQNNPLVNVNLNATSGATAKAFDTTATHTIQIVASWGGTNTGQSLTTYRTRVTRRF